MNERHTPESDDRETAPDVLAEPQATTEETLEREYDAAVSDGSRVTKPRIAPDDDVPYTVESNSSNYGASAVDAGKAP